MFYKTLKPRAKFFVALKTTNCRKTTHTEFTQVFADSGYWDYLLLSKFSSLMQSIVVNSTNFITEHTIIEKAPYRFQRLVFFINVNFLTFTKKASGFYVLFHSVWFSTILFSLIALLAQLSSYVIRCVPICLFD